MAGSKPEPGAGGGERPGDAGVRGAGEPSDPAEGVAPYSATCDLCGTMMYGRHCKLVCRQCGYVRDCSDP